MKIALVDPIGAKMGMNHYNDGLMNALSAKGFSTFILSNYKSQFEAVQSKIFFKNINKSGTNAALNNLKGIIRSIRFCSKEKADYVMMHIFRGGVFDLFSLFLAKIFSLRIILIVHDIETIDTTPNKFIKKMVLIYFHDFIVVHNQFSLEKIKEYTGKKTIHDIHVIPHGNYSHLQNFLCTRQEALDYFKLDPAQNYILFFGQIKKTKGLDILLEAISLSKSSFKLIIAGKPRIKNFDLYQKIIDQYQLQDRVIPILRFITEDETRRLFSLCDAIVLPYKVIYQSGVLLLAMSFGKIVIASDLEPFKEIIQHGVNGLLFEKGNPKSLAEASNMLFDKKFNINLIEKNAKEFAEKNFSWPNIANEYARLLF